MRLKLLTYNIHRCVGTDGRYDLDRVASVIGDARPDIVALQELDSGIERSAFHDQAALLAEKLCMTASFCATRVIDSGEFGLAILSRFTPLAKYQYDISHRPRREPRSCLRVDLALGDGTTLHVFNCHLGLATQERRFQCRRMLSDAILLSEELHHPVVLMGDFNDRPLSVVHGRLREHFVDAFRACGRRRSESPTFRVGPIRLRLDHIYVSRDVRVADCSVRREGAATVASDHQPLFAEVELGHPTDGISSTA